MFWKVFLPWRVCVFHCVFDADTLLAPLSTENLALRGKATQLARYPHDFGAAYNAIDGNRESAFHSGSCTHSAELTDPWWRLDLLHSYVITSISITNRGDCCEHRLDNLNIHVGNSTTSSGLDNPQWVTGEACPPHQTHGQRWSILDRPGCQRILSTVEWTSFHLLCPIIFSPIFVCQL